MRTWIALYLSLLACGLGGQQTGPQPLAAYHDESLGFTFHYPAEFAAVPAAAAATGKAGCEDTPLTSVRHVGEHQEEMLLILRVHFGCLGRLATVDVLQPMAKNILTNILERIGPPEMKNSAAYTLDGHDAVFLQGTAPDKTDGIPGHAGVACVLLSDDVVCWSALTAYPSHVRAIFSNQVQFGDHPANALVPDDHIVTPTGKDP